MKKTLAIIIVILVSFSTTGCEMDAASMEMIMSFLGGLSGYTGSAFNSSGNSDNQQWAMAGSQIQKMWMSQSENNQQGRGMSAMLQANQMSVDFAKETAAKSATSKTLDGKVVTTTTKTDTKTDSKSTEDQTWYGDLYNKGLEKAQDLDAKDVKKLGGLLGLEAPSTDRK